MKSIFEYIDYRAFLKDYYDNQKSLNKYFSYRVFALKAGIKSPVFYQEVTSGKKNISQEMIEKFSYALNFNEKETEYFKNLVMFDQAKTAREKQSYYVLLRSMENIKSENTLNGDQYDYLSKWYNVIIRELITLYDFKDDFEKLAQSVIPPIKTREAKAAVDLLIRLGLIKKQPNGEYVQTDTAITTQTGIASLAIRHFNKSMLLQAITALEELPKTDRNIFGVTMGVSPAMYDILCAEMAAFKDRIVTLVSRDKKSSSVFQLNLQLFRVSKDVSDIDTEGENVP